MSSANVSGTVGCTSEGAALSALDVSRMGLVWPLPPVRKSSAPMSTAIFAASSFASFFLAKTGCVAYERRTPSGFVMVRMHCLSGIEVRGGCKRGEELTPRTGLFDELELQGVRVSKCALAGLIETGDGIAIGLAGRGGNLSRGRRWGTLAVEVVLEGDGANVGQVFGDAVERRLGNVEHVLAPLSTAQHISLCHVFN